jgi:hypothetical protein
VFFSRKTSGGGGASVRASHPSKSAKGGAAAARKGFRKFLGERWSSPHLWQKRFYDFNVWNERKRVEKLWYMHRNPVKRGLVAAREQ